MNKIFGISVTLQRNKPFTFQLTWAESLREFFVPAVRQLARLIVCLHVNLLLSSSSEPAGQKIQTIPN